MTSLRLLRSGIPIGTGIGMAALGFVVADHGFGAIAVALWCIATVVFVLGVVAALVDVHAERQRARADVEQKRREAIMQQLRKEYSKTHPAQAIALLTGTGRLPKDWVDARLAEMGETWRQDVYR